MTLGGWYLTKKTDDARSRREGNFETPLLTTTIAGLRTPPGSPLLCTYVLEDVPDSTAAAVIPVGVANTGRRPAEDVLLVASFPDQSPQRSKPSIEVSGLFPGREEKCEKIGRLLQVSMYLPHLTPGTGATIALPVPLNETRVRSTHDVRTLDGVPATLAVQFDFAMTFNAQLVSKEKIWPGASAHISVSHGRTLLDVATAVRDRIREEDRARFSLHRGGFAARALATLRYRRFRVSDDRRFYFIVPALRPVKDEGRTWPPIIEDGSRSACYVMFDTGRQWTIIRTPTDADDVVEVIAVLPEA